MLLITPVSTSTYMWLHVLKYCTATPACGSGWLPGWLAGWLECVSCQNTSTTMQTSAAVGLLLAHCGLCSLALALEPPPLVHPGVMVTLPMLQHMRSAVKARQEPQWSAYLDIMNPNHTIGPTEGGRSAVWLANLSYTPEPERLWVVNKSLSPGTRWLSNKEDALAAYTHALLWFITEDERHAIKSIQIMDAWAGVLKQPIIAADGLEAAWSGTGWCRAAEIIKHTTRQELWPAENIAAFSDMLTKIYLPWVNEGASTNGNIALVMSETFLHIGVFTDNRTLVDAAIALWKEQVCVRVLV